MNNEVTVSYTKEIIFSRRAFFSLKKNIQWSEEILGLTAVRDTDAVKKGEGIKVAVLDTGIDYKHSDLAPNIKGGISIVDDYSTDFMDVNSHGTHCAGIIGAIENETGVTGVAPKCDIYGVKVLGSGGSGSYDSIAKGIYWAIENHMDIISMSLGGSQDYLPLHLAVTSATNKGIWVVCAAGNESEGDATTMERSYPGMYPEVVSVAASDKFNHIAYFSNNNDEIDITAPGVNIISTIPDNKYASYSGTSMACPLISGVLALMKGEKYDLKFEDAKRLLFETADDFGKVGKDVSFGYGIVDPKEIFDKLKG